MALKMTTQEHKAVLNSYRPTLGPPVLVFGCFAVKQGTDRITLAVVIIQEPECNL